jgi:hypothetical protein
MITSGREWIGDSDMNNRGDSERPDEKPAQLSNEEYRILSQCIGICVNELFEEEREVLESLVGDGLAFVDEVNGVISLSDDGAFAVRNWEPADDPVAWSGGFAENH